MENADVWMHTLLRKDRRRDEDGLAKICCFVDVLPRSHPLMLYSCYVDADSLDKGIAAHSKGYIPQGRHQAHNIDQATGAFLGKSSPGQTITAAECTPGT